METRQKLVYSHFKQTLLRVQPAISEDRLVDEWRLLKQLVSRKYTTKNLSWSTIFKENDGVNLIMLLVDLMLTIPSTSVLCETAFSQMKLLKTCRRSRLGSSALNDLMMVKLQSRDISAFQPDRAIDNWMTASVRKMTYKRAKKAVPESTNEPVLAPRSPVVITDVESESTVESEATPEQEPVVSEEAHEPVVSEPSVVTLDSEEEELGEPEVEESVPPSISGSYLSIEDELETLCDKDWDHDDADEDCYDFQDEMSNLDMLMTFLRE